MKGKIKQMNISETIKPTQTTYDLTVKGESVERLYGYYIEHRFLVNRRYQRKLVWSVEEKSNFIDSLIRNYPIPIILLAEDKSDKNNNLLEIIDGMQRLNAITSFIENEWAYDGHYFDLQTMAATKLSLDNGLLKQKTPVLDRKKCAQFVSYFAPISIYEFTDIESVDEVFRRINSGGRQLSRQELRAAGATGHFANAVRKISSNIRGDSSATDMLRLNSMKLISITNRELDYGLPVHEIFWVKEGILTKEDVRLSRDEELVSDLVSYMVSDAPPSSRSEYIDHYFGIVGDDAAKKRFDEMEGLVQRRSVKNVNTDFIAVISKIKEITNTASEPLSRILFPDGVNKRLPRYFQVVFLALHELITKERLVVKSIKKLAEKMNDSGRHIIVAEGGRWGSEQRINSVNSYKGLIKPLFKKPTSSTPSPADVHWITEIENLLTQSLTEQANYDFKQGFLRLDGNRDFDDQSFEKILKTAVGISNIKQNSIGYIGIGISDATSTTERIKNLDKVDPKRIGAFDVVGIDREFSISGKNVDQFFQWITDKIKISEISEPLRTYLSANIKLVSYYDKSVIIIESAGQKRPSQFSGIYYVRRGNQVEEIKQEGLFDFIEAYIHSSVGSA